MTSDREGIYRAAYTYGLERISVRDLVEPQGKPNNPLYYLYDGHGSVTQLANKDGNVKDKYRYDPYGVSMPEGKLSPNTRDLNNPYGYNGEDYDIESDLQFLRARYYEPEDGRFLTRDSYLGNVMEPISQHRYTYAHNNPVMYSDPSGHFIFAVATGIAGAIIGGAVGAYKSYKETGSVQLGSVAKGALIGGAAGALIGAGGAFLLTGSATASMGAVGTEVVTKAAAGIVAGSSWIANKGSQLYDKGKRGLETLKWGFKSPGNAKIVTQNATYKYGQKVAEEFADFFFGNNENPKEYLKDKFISNSLIKTFERMTQTKVKTCNEQKLNQISQQSAPTKSGVKELTFASTDSATLGSCFVAGTLIYTEDGYKEIQEIKEGDKVYSENPETGEKGLKKVKRLFVHDEDKILNVYVGETKIETTHEHPFWVVDKGWVFAGDLNIGDKVLLYSGETKEITKLEEKALDEKIKVYNFEVEDWHTYFVSEDSVLVHNKPMKHDPSKEMLDDDYVYGTYEGESKAIPNPNGKNGGPLHQGKIQETADKLKSQGYDVSFEKYVKTEGGFKSSRYGDILATEPKTGEQFIIQVGKQTKAGNPISRENKAIQDLTNAGWKVEFVPYN